MAAYKIEKWVSGLGTLNEVAAEMEVKLETLDSTTNVLRLTQVVKPGGGTQFQGILIYDIA
ncbi:MAG TPA: hypothetical protein ENK70_07980 [Methylophaga sp.]|nr:hypothetical protein [Methylophaga sp.]